jgi:hypothetical protein
MESHTDVFPSVMDFLILARQEEVKKANIYI